MNKPNILFLMIDSFRADKCVGDRKTSLTPNIDYLIKHGVYFNQAVSAADGTAPSWAALFTSAYPFRTGITGEIPSKLHPETENLVNVLKNAGYHTYGFMPDYADALGLTDPFENKDNSYAGYDPLSTGMGKKIMKILSDNTLKAPWLLFVHFLDLHWPFSAPADFQDERYGDTQYDKSISFIDSWIGKFLKKISFDNTLVILTADHGEKIPVIYRNNKAISFEGGISHRIFDPKKRHKIPSILYPIARRVYGFQRTKQRNRLYGKLKSLELTTTEQRAFTGEANFEVFDHNIYDESIRIPLIFSGCTNKQKIITQQVRSVDIFPTILELIGISKPTGIDGMSLVPLIDGSPLDEMPAYIETNHKNKLNQYLMGVRTSSYKYCREKNNENKPFLADLQKDPSEENNIAKERSDIVLYMENTLTNILKDSISNLKEPKDDYQQKLIEKELKKLGYI